jgi:hypothetical protein
MFVSSTLFHHLEVLWKANNNFTPLYCQFSIRNHLHLIAKSVMKMYIKFLDWTRFTQNLIGIAKLNQTKIIFQFFMRIAHPTISEIILCLIGNQCLYLKKLKNKKKKKKKKCQCWYDIYLVETFPHANLMCQQRIEKLYYYI